MGIFNTKIFEELEQGFQNLRKRIDRNLGRDKKSLEAFKCKNCGATIKIDTDTKILKCEYCGSEIENKNYIQDLDDFD